LERLEHGGWQTSVLRAVWEKKGTSAGRADQFSRIYRCPRGRRRVFGVKKGIKLAGLAWWELLRSGAPLTPRDGL
jgi:hypothetical protein